MTSREPAWGQRGNELIQECRKSSFVVLVSFPLGLSASFTVNNDPIIHELLDLSSFIQVDRYGTLCSKAVLSCLFLQIPAWRAVPMYRTYAWLC